MFNISTMICGDTKTRADNAALFGRNFINSQSGSDITAKTAAYTILAAEYGKAFSNTGASGSVTLTLPAPKAGMRLLFFKTANQTLVVVAASNTTLNEGTTATNSTSGDQDKGYLELTGISDTAWRITNREGTWTIS